MKKLSVLVSLFFIVSCSPSQTEIPKTTRKSLSDTTDQHKSVLRTDAPEKEEIIPENFSKLDTTCSAITFLNLKNSEVQNSFFQELDSAPRHQYTEIIQDTNIMVDITPKYLLLFLDAIDEKSLKEANYFSQDYHFNIAPPQYSDPKKCTDRIAITYNPDSRSFTLQVFNTFLVEPDWCTESMVIYMFKLQGGSITNFARHEAG